MLYQGSCHCGNISFEVEGELYAVRECNCSLCSRLGALRWFVASSAVRFMTPESTLTPYQFGKKKVKHYFCTTCGCAPMGRANYNDVDMFSINVRCLEDVEISALKIKPVDGKNF